MMDEVEDDPIIEEAPSERDDIEEYADDIIAPGDEADAEEAMLARKEASNLAKLARQYANRMQFAAATAVGLARDVEAACTTARDVAQRTAHLAKTAIGKKRKHEEREDARKAASMEIESNHVKIEQDQMEEVNLEGSAHVILVSTEKAYAEKAGVACKEAAKLAGMAYQYAHILMFTAEEAMGLFKDLQANCTEANGVTHRSACTAKRGLRKKQKQVKQGKGRKKQMSPLQEETRERSKNGTRKRRKDAVAASSNSSTGSSTQKQQQYRRHARPLDYPLPLSLVTSSLKRSLPTWKRKK